MKLFILIITLIPLTLYAQLEPIYSSDSPQKMRGEVFKAYADHPSEDLRETTIVVNRSLYRITYEDRDIPEKYKKAVKTFFKRRYNGFTRTGKYELNVKKRDDDIFIEGKRINPNGL